MAIRDTTIVAIEGTHATGKTTLVQHLTAHYRPTLDQRHLLRRARPHQPLHRGDRPARQGQLRPGHRGRPVRRPTPAPTACRPPSPARHLRQDHRQRARLRSPGPGRSRRQHRTARAGRHGRLLPAWAPVYDAAFYLHDRYDRYDAHAIADSLRARVLDLQDAADHAVRAACTDSGISLMDVPTGLDLDARIRWVAERLTDLGMIRG